MIERPEKDVNTEPTNVTEPEIESTEPKAENAGQDTQEQGSTIFVKHVYDTKKPTKNGNVKRLLICLVALVLCGAVIGSIFLTKALLPEDPVTESSSVPEESTIPVVKYKDVVKDSFVEIDGQKVEVDTNIESVHFVNGYEEFTAVPFFTKAEPKKETTSSTSSTASSAASSATSSGTTSSETKKEYLYDTNWQVKDIDKSKTVSDAIFEAIENCLNISAFREMENSFASVEEYHKYYGMTDKLNAGIVVKFNDGTEDLMLTVGSAVANGESYYFMSSRSDTIYAITSDSAENFFCSTKEFADPTVVPAYVKTEDNKSYFNESGKLARFDSIKITGDVFGGKTYEFELNKGVSADYMPYRMKLPYSRPASDSFIGTLLNLIGDGIDASVLYSYSATDKDREECGLDNPKCIVEVKIKDYRLKLIIGGARNDGTESLSAMVEGKDQVYGIDQDDLAFLINASNDITQMFNPNFIMEDIYTLKSLDMKVKSGSYRFDIKHTARPDDEDVFDTEVKLGTSVMDTQSFKHLYQSVLMLSLLEFVTEAEKTEPVLAISFNFIEGGSKLVEFTESPDDMYHYTAWVDGTPLGEVLKSSVTYAMDNLEIYLNGGEVPDNW